jgi:hypothetical protein
MTVHILNGDALAKELAHAGFEGETIICRECLIDGPVNADGLFAFWKARAGYIARMYDEDPETYYRKVKAEFDKIERLPAHAEVNLWFENDLFCQTNMWFVISLLNRRGITRVFRVCPLQARGQRNWKGFGEHTQLDLRICFDEREPLAVGDFRLGEHLWNAYRTGNLEVLSLLSKSLSPSFPLLDEVCEAEVERKTHARPQQTLREIVDMGYTTFDDIFKKFSERDGVYGYGDLQVVHMLRSLPGNSVQLTHGSVR